MIYKKVPHNFQQRFEVASCFVEANGEFLLLHRRDDKSQGDKWGVPGGKIEEGESREAALLREVREEIGLIFSGEEPQYFDSMYVRYPDYDFLYHMFHIQLERKPELILNASEHKDFRWATPYEALRLDLVQDEDACIRLFYAKASELLIAQSSLRARTLDEVYAAIVGILRHLREDFSYPSIGYVSGVVTSDGPDKIGENLKRLQNIAVGLREEHFFPILSPPDIFSLALIERLEKGGIKGEDFVQFWRSILFSGYITDIFMTPRWQESYGACDEHKTAMRIGLQIHYL